MKADALTFEILFILGVVIAASSFFFSKFLKITLLTGLLLMVIAVIREAIVLKKKESAFITNAEIKKVLQITNSLLSKLPKEEIANFAKTEESKAYEKILDKYGVK